MLSDEEISNSQEQNTVRDYCLNHELARPDTNIKTVLKTLVVLKTIILALTFGIEYLLSQLDISFAFLNLYIAVSIIVFGICLKRLCVLAIELYQRYASDATRRKCTLMPSCSEYALLALQKYNVFKGLYKIHIRLTRRCNGVYVIDYP